MHSNILILSSPKLTAAAKSVMKEMQQAPDVTIRDVKFGHVVPYLNTHLSTLKPDIIITGGVHWEMLSKSDYPAHVPIIPIPITQFDLLQAAVHARQYGNQIAIIQYGHYSHQQKELLADFDCTFHFHTYQTKQELIMLISALNQNGIDAIIGTSLVCVIADSFHIPSVFLHSKDSIKKILDHVTRLEIARQEMMATAQKWSLEFMKSPVLAYDIQTSSTHDTMPLPLTVPGPHPMEDKKWALLEDFLFQTKLSNLFPLDNSVPFDKHYPYVSFGIMDGPKQTIECFCQKLEAEHDIRIKTVTKGKKARLLVFSRQLFSSTFLNEQLTYLASTCSGGFSTPLYYHDVFQSDQSFMKQLNEATIASKLAQSEHFSSALCLFDYTNPYTLIYNMMKQNLLPDTPFIEPLFGHRNTDKLLHTLRLLLDHGLSITTVANHLGMSRQTVYALLNRIEELIGLLTNPEKRFVLSLELRVLDIKKVEQTIQQQQSHPTFLSHII